jgi:GNAT superfamily N-acetyltransferase
VIDGVGATSIRRLDPDAWAPLREVRLAALRDAPYAFGATIDDEERLEESAWRQRLHDQAWFVAFAGERPIGVACGGQLREPAADVRTLRAMWVAPGHRGDGTSGELVAHVAQWARDDGASTLTLWATEAAARARSFYLRFGFVATGEVAEMPHGDHPPMARYALAL